MTRDAHVFRPTFHASSDGSAFGATLCGFTPQEDESVWVTQIATDVNCLLCLEATDVAQFRMDER